MWVPDKDRVWLPATITSPFSNTGHLELELENEEKLTLTVTTPTELPPLRNPDMLLGVSDLTSLSHLHEPAVLHNLTHRYLMQQSIYTYCGEWVWSRAGHMTMSHADHMTKSHVDHMTTASTCRDCSSSG